MTFWKSLMHKMASSIRPPLYFFLILTIVWMVLLSFSSIDMMIIPSEHSWKTWQLELSRPNAFEKEKKICHCQDFNPFFDPWKDLLKFLKSIIGAKSEICSWKDVPCKRNYFLKVLLALDTNCVNKFTSILYKSNSKL